MNLELDNLVILRASPNAACCELDGGAAIIDLVSGVYFKLNSTASYFYSILEQPTSFSAALAKMQDQFNVEPGVLEADLNILVRNLLDIGLIVIEG